MAVPLTLYRPDAQGECYDARIAFGSTTPGPRGPLTTEGVDSSGGAQSFVLPTGTASLGWLIEYAGQRFKVDGATPLPPFAVMTRYDTVQYDGPLAILEHVTIDGERIQLDADSDITICEDD